MWLPAYFAPNSRENIFNYKFDSSRLEFPSSVSDLKIPRNVLLPLTSRLVSWKLNFTCQERRLFGPLNWWFFGDSSFFHLPKKKREQKNVHHNMWHIKELLCPAAFYRICTDIQYRCFAGCRALQDILQNSYIIPTGFVFKLKAATFWLQDKAERRQKKHVFTIIQKYCQDIIKENIERLSQRIHLSVCELSEAPAGTLRSAGLWGRAEMTASS